MYDQQIERKLDAVEKRIKQLTEERNILINERKILNTSNDDYITITRKIDTCSAEIYKLSFLSKSERFKYIDLDINLYPDFPEYTKKIITLYGIKNNWPNPITPRVIFEKGSTAILFIPELGFYSMTLFQRFFKARNLDWKD